ncbi:MAG: hypothetical protein RL710_677 [Pseudomonadota bacterium]|jgi:uncharacterized protein YdaU (DUF1376 family)
MNLKICIVLAVIALLNACATPEEIAANERRWAQERARVQEQKAAEEASSIQIWTDRCAGYGHQRGTAAMANCVQSEAHAYAGRVQRAEAQAAADEEARKAGIRSNLCLLGNRQFCDNQPVQTTCRRDALGRVNCTSQ